MREKDKQWYDRREGRFEPPKLEKIAMLPLVEPPPFEMPVHLTQMLAENEKVALLEGKTEAGTSLSLSKNDAIQLHVKSDTPISKDDSVSGPRLAFDKGGTNLSLIVQIFICHSGGNSASWVYRNSFG